MHEQTKTEYIQLTIRLPKSLHSAVSEIAAGQNWSLNRMVIRALDKTFRPGQENIEDIYGVDNENGQQKGGRSDN